MPAAATKENWMVKGSCTCPVYFKEYMCKHIVGLALSLQLAEAPLAARNVPLGEKRRPGRPAQSVLALLHQPRESILAEEAEEDVFNLDDEQEPPEEDLPAEIEPVLVLAAQYHG